MKFTEAATPPPLAIDVVPGDPGAVHVTVTGEIDMLTAPDFAAILTEVVNTRPRSVLVDLTGVSFLDAAGMTVLIRADHRARRIGVDIELVNAQPLVFRALSVVDLVEFLHVTPYRHER